MVMLYGVSTWVAAYLVAEFWLQTRDMARWRREEPSTALLHAACVAAMLWGSAGSWRAGGWVMLATLGHGVIEWWGDRGMERAENRLRRFLTVQGMQILWLMGIATRMSWGRGMVPVTWWWSVSALVLLTRGGGQFMECLLAQCMPVERTGTVLAGGRWTGYLERLLVALCVWSGVYEGIGFLIAGKSILRFREVKADNRRSEYVLIGTMASFLWAIFVSLGLKMAIKAQ